MQSQHFQQSTVKTFPMTGPQCACAARGASRLATSVRKRAAANHRRPQCVWKQHANTSRLTRVRNFLNQEPLPCVISHQEQCLYDRLRHRVFNQLALRGFNSLLYISAWLVKKGNMENPEVADRETISLIIKTPNQFHGDQVIEGVRMDWTVKDFKCHLSKVYPSNPVGLGLCS